MANKMWKDSEADLDLLNFNYLAEQVVEIAKDEELSPATIGVYGDWGSGKSSLMKMVKKTLDSDKKTLTVEFNGWLFEGYEDAKTALCGTILDEMHKHKTLFAKGKDKIEALLEKVDGGKLLSKGVKFGLDYLLTGGLGSITELTLTGIISAVKQKAGNVTEKEIKTVIDSFKDDESVWYRSRMVDGKERVLKAKDMFHVPFELVRKIGNNRFSISGYPCLYLSNTIWACWEEMKEPSMEDFCTSLLKPTREIELLDLRLPNIAYDHEVDKVLCSLPLIIACSIEVEYPDDPFKPEYAIPQIVMLALVNHPRFQGCSFTSTKKIDNFDWPDDLLTNIAMPVRCVNEEGLCPKLSEYFLITDSINYKYEVLKCNVSPTRVCSEADIEEIFGGPHVEETIYEDYEGSMFGQLEKVLKEDYKPKRIE